MYSVSSRPEFIPHLMREAGLPARLNDVSRSGGYSRTTGIAICFHSGTRGQIGNLRGNDNVG